MFDVNDIPADFARLPPASSGGLLLGDSLVGGWWFRLVCGQTDAGRPGLPLHCRLARFLLVWSHAGGLCPIVSRVERQFVVGGLTGGWVVVSVGLRADRRRSAGAAAPLSAGFCFPVPG